MNIEQFRDVEVITEGFYPVETKEKEFDFCLPLCDNKGYFIELGVWQGACINYMASSYPQYHFYGFDTFDGVDEIWETGRKIINMKQYFQVSEDYIDHSTGLPKVHENVTLIKGLFQDTLDDWLQEHEGHISFINMDPDIYSSVIYSLEKLNDRIVPGTIIRFDELSCWRTVGFPGYVEGKNHTLLPYTRWEEGEWKALIEWMEKYDREVKPLWRNWHQSAGVEVIK